MEINRCSYCYSDNPTHETHCISCNAPMNVQRRVLQECIKVEEIDLFFIDYPFLLKLNNVDLLNLLLIAREAIRKNEAASTGDKEKIRELLQKKAHLIENMIFDSMGRVPPTLHPSEIKRIENLRIKQIKKHVNLMVATKEKVEEPPHHIHYKSRFLSKF